MSKSEKDHFSEYLKSPYFNPKAAKMLEDAFHLLRDIKDESWEKWDTRERVLRSLYPNEPEVATQDLMKRLLKLNTTLKKKLQVFLIHIAFKNTQIKDIEAVKGLLLLRILRERGLEEEFLREYWVQTKKWEAKKIKDWDDFQVKRDLLIEYYNYLAQDSRSNAAEILEIHRLQVDVAAQEYRIRILWLACLSMNQSLTLKGDDTLPDIASIMELLESNPPLLQANAYLHLLYYLCRMLMGVGGRADYAAFENLLAQHANDLSQKLYLGLVTLAISHCKRKILAGDTTYQKTANDLLYLQLDVFIQSGKKIPEKIFRNHVLVRARISEKSGDFSEVWKIFQQLKRNVTGKDETCFFRYIEGLLFFYEGKYWEAIERLDGI
ncbi:MAG TPA: hypothetical protein ENJ82_11255, partial [Bacteroidetes bacterium]|nr:hypothetical protein [Bacteroidota bacterium]